MSQETYPQKTKVLFLCTGNSCRSQMAEGLARHLKGNRIDAYSAGIETHGINPYAVTVMKEIGIDISNQRSKHVSEFANIKFDLVITVCDHAQKSCPIFHGNTKVVHVGFDDSPKLAAACESEEAKFDCYRCVRDEIKRFVETLLGESG